jgi:hypothetical protein
VHYEDELVEVMNHCAAALQRERSVPGADGEEDEEGETEEQAEDFVTALVAQVPDRADGPVVQVVNRGHLPPLVLHEGKVQALTASSPVPPLGLEDLVSGPPAKAESYPFAPGDRLLLYTDGVIEARNRDNDFFALPQAMEGVHARTPPDFLEQLIQGLIRHTQGYLADDVAMMLVDRLDEEIGERVGTEHVSTEEEEGGHVSSAAATSDEDAIDHLPQRSRGLSA